MLLLLNEIAHVECYFLWRVKSLRTNTRPEGAPMLYLLALFIVVLTRHLNIVINCRLKKAILK